MAEKAKEKGTQYKALFMFFLLCPEQRILFLTLSSVCIVLTYFSLQKIKISAPSIVFVAVEVF